MAEINVIQNVWIMCMYIVVYYYLTKCYKLWKMPKLEWYIHKEIKRNKLQTWEWWCLYAATIQSMMHLHTLQWIPNTSYMYTAIWKWNVRPSQIHAITHMLHYNWVEHFIVICIPLITPISDGRRTSWHPWHVPTDNTWETTREWGSWTPSNLR